ncbi:MAG: sulfate adenylyltransferase subunit CysN, partial [Gammaproteobacteria bacterium]|nr:sulfate adenylyltransferase subunit CysN [Gammaproteobacteria bacterium]
ISTAGSVDDGKSTLIGRLLTDSKNIYEDQLSSLEKLRRNNSDPDLAFLLDGLKAEREQGITIDVAYRYFSTPGRKFIIADTPGHDQYTRNMATGASTANLSIVLIDARKGLLTQSKRHAFISSLFGINHIVVAVNKMDLVEYNESVFEEIKQSFVNYAAKLNIGDIRFVPISALHGDNVVEMTDRMAWYHGPTILEVLEDVQFLSDRNLIDLRFPVQYVIRPNQDFRSYAGTVSSGIMRTGDEVLILPGEIRTRIKSIDTYDGEIEVAFPPMSVSVRLEDEVDVSRGDMIVHAKNLPRAESRFEAMVIWMSETPMETNSRYILKHATQAVNVRMDQLLYRVDIETQRKQSTDRLALNEIGRVAFTAARPLFYDAYQKNRDTGCFIIADYLTNHTIAAGMILDRMPTDESLPTGSKGSASAAEKSSSHSRVTPSEHRALFGQAPSTIWLTGSTGSARSELALALKQVLQTGSTAAVVLDSVSMRDRLSGDLGFSEADEIEHLRRVAEITRLLNDQGLTVVASVLAPDETNLCQMIELIGRDRCIEISLDALNQVFVDKPSNRCDVTSRHVVFDEQNGTEIGAEGSLKALLTVSAGAEWLKEPIAHILTGLQRSGSLRSG